MFRQSSDDWLHIIWLQLFVKNNVYHQRQPDSKTPGVPCVNLLKQATSRLQSRLANFETAVILQTDRQWKPEVHKANDTALKSNNLRINQRQTLLCASTRLCYLLWPDQWPTFQFSLIEHGQHNILCYFPHPPGYTHTHTHTHTLHTHTNCFVSLKFGFIIYGFPYKHPDLYLFLII